eukprot:1856540-Prymnesium_polylepis.2
MVELVGIDRDDGEVDEEGHEERACRNLGCGWDPGSGGAVWAGARCCYEGFGRRAQLWVAGHDDGWWEQRRTCGLETCIPDGVIHAAWLVARDLAR